MWGLLLLIGGGMVVYYCCTSGQCSHQQPDYQHKKYEMTKTNSSQYQPTNYTEEEDADASWIIV